MSEIPVGMKIFYGRRYKRWDVYPENEPLEIVGYCGSFFWKFSRTGMFWFKIAAKFVLSHSISIVAYKPNLDFIVEVLDDGDNE